MAKKGNVKPAQHGNPHSTHKTTRPKLSKHHTYTKTKSKTATETVAGLGTPAPTYTNCLESWTICGTEQPRIMASPGALTMIMIIGAIVIGCIIAQGF